MMIAMGPNKPFNPKTPANGRMPWYAYRAAQRDLIAFGQGMDGGHRFRILFDAEAEASYTDYKLGITKNFDKGFAVAVAYFDTNAQEAVYTNLFGHFLGRSTGVVTVTKTF